MPEPFDPYHRWLGISPKDQPPHHYRLLGIDQFEADPDVIEGAADQRMAHLKRFNTGKHSALAEKLLTEVAAARVCLLNPAKRAIYDQALREQLAARAVPAGDAFLSQFGTAPSPSRPPLRPAMAKTKAKTGTRTPWIAILAVVAGLAAVVLIIVLTGPGNKGVQDAHRAGPTEAVRPKRSNPARSKRRLFRAETGSHRTAEARFGRPGTEASGTRAAPRGRHAAGPRCGCSAEGTAEGRKTD